MADQNNEGVSMTYTIEVSYDDYDSLSLKMAMSDESMARDYAEELADRIGRDMFRAIVVKKWDMLEFTEIKRISGSV